MQCRSECEKHVRVWEQCINEVGTNAEAKEALNTIRQQAVCYCERFFRIYMSCTCRFLVSALALLSKAKFWPFFTPTRCNLNFKTEFAGNILATPMLGSIGSPCLRKIPDDSAAWLIFLKFCSIPQGAKWFMGAIWPAYMQHKYGRSRSYRRGWADFLLVERQIPRFRLFFALSFSTSCRIMHRFSNVIWACIYLYMHNA